MSTGPFEEPVFAPFLADLSVEEYAQVLTEVQQMVEDDGEEVGN